MTPSPSELLNVCNEAAQAGAKELRHWEGRFHARHKGPRDLVTEADLASEQAIRRVISQQFPEHGILGEEAPAPEQLQRSYCWIVDPLDGTTNYAHGLPFYCVSIAVVREGRLLAGMILDPVRDECFAAAAGEPARLNGKTIVTSNAKILENALLAVSFPALVKEESVDLQAFLNVTPRCQAVRRTGSSALNLAYVASGRLDGHWAHEIHPWDAAAGILLVQQAGGKATAVRGGPYDVAAGPYLVAATPELHAALLPLVSPS